MSTYAFKYIQVYPSPQPFDKVEVIGEGDLSDLARNFIAAQQEGVECRLTQFIEVSETRH